jgi:hypothetical protein
MIKENPLLSQLLRQKAIQWKNGRVTLWGLNFTFSAIFSQVYLQRVMETQLEPKEAMKLLYWQGKFQCIQGISITDKKHGYAKKLQEKVERLKLLTDQSEITGLGTFQWVRIDFEKEVFVLKGDSTFAREYKLFVGQQDHTIDYHLRGQVAGIIEYFLEKEVLCVQTKCIAKGDKFCEYVVKPLSEWDTGDPLYVEQYVDQYLKLCNIGQNQKEPYLAYESKMN